LREWLRHDRLRAVECNTYIDIGFQEEYLDSITLARQIVDAIEEKQATAIVLMDVHELTNIAAYFVIATVDNDRQAKAIEDSLLETLKLQQNIRPLHAEGLGGQGGGWSILDYGDVIVHLFTEEMREYYKLEELWSKAQVLVKML
jgi:ribosome-associated protein